jgi:transcriptional regulator with XRE-family HTH domain
MSFASLRSTYASSDVRGIRRAFGPIRNDSISGSSPRGPWRSNLNNVARLTRSSFMASAGLSNMVLLSSLTTGSYTFSVRAQLHRYVVVSRSMPETHREPADERFGANLRQLREKAGMSQSALAAAMRKRGHKWYQQTVGRVEDGQQSARIGEAEDLAVILKTSVDRLTWTTEEASAGILLDMTTARASTAWGQIKAWTADLLHAQYQLGVSIGEAEQAGCYGSDRIRGIAREARAALTRTPESAVDAGREYHDELRAAADAGFPGGAEPGALECPPLIHADDEGSQR